MALALSRRRRGASLFPLADHTRNADPATDYLTFHDELVRRFYKDDDTSHFALGRESARWTLVDGPCKSFLEQKDLRGFVGSFPKFWETC